MTPADLTSVGLLAGKLIRMHHAFDPARFMAPPPNPERGYARWMRTQLELDEVILLVCEDETGIAGYAYARFEPLSWDELRDACVMLHDIFVDERARGRGYAEALLREVFARSRAMGAPRVVLMTATQNASAQRLFERVGFRTTMFEMTVELNPPQT
jgi:ribosomal protein S18 acetylase RimI-like enzyme